MLNDVLATSGRDATTLVWRNQLQATQIPENVARIYRQLHALLGVFFDLENVQIDG